MVTRRRLLFLLGAGATGLWVAGTGLVTLARRFVLELAGLCSFCGKQKTEVRALAGVVGRPVRICDECVGLCQDIIAEESAKAPPRPQPESSTDEELMAYLKELGAEAGDLDKALAALKQKLEGKPERWNDLACSFCDTHRKDCHKLISGPRVFICDLCAADASVIVKGVLLA